MADKLVFIRLFNAKAEEFCKDLVSTFPEVNEFKRLKTALMLLTNIDERKPHEIFNRFMIDQFRDRILNKDETFFMNEVHEHSHVIQHIPGADESQWDRIVDLLRSLWSSLTEDNKETIWKYFHVLIAVHDKCHV